MRQDSLHGAESSSSTFKISLTIIGPLKSINQLDRYHERNECSVREAVDNGVDYPRPTEIYQCHVPLYFR